jgi:hypothetical protein
MSVKLILAFVLVGLIGYVLGRRSARRRGGDDGRDGEPMLETSSEPRTLDAAVAAHAASALNADSLEEIKRHLRDRRLIEAVKIYRLRTGCSLSEAKDRVESIQKNL